MLLVVTVLYLLAVSVYALCRLSQSTSFTCTLVLFLLYVARKEGQSRRFSSALPSYRFSSLEGSSMRYIGPASYHKAADFNEPCSEEGEKPKVYWTLASFSLAAAFSTVSAISFSCLTVIQPPRLTSATVWIKACFYWYSLYLFPRCSFFLVCCFSFLIIGCYFPVPAPDSFYVSVTSAHAFACSRNYPYNKLALSWKCHSMCESPSSLLFFFFFFNRGLTWELLASAQRLTHWMEALSSLSYQGKVSAAPQSARLQKIWK